MIEEIRLLEELQQIDSRIRDLEAERDAIPAELRTRRESLTRIENVLAEERARLAEAEKYYRDQEVELSNEESLINKAKLKLQHVKNTREYMATTRELEALRKIAGERQEELLKMMDAVEQTRASVQQHDGELTELRAEVGRLEAESQGKLADLEGKLTTERGQRDELTKRIRPDVLKRYRQIRLRRGLAVVEVRDATCLGCNVAIPPQLYNILLRREGLQSCPNCHRIIYVGPPDSQAESPSESA